MDFGSALMRTMAVIIGLSEDVDRGPGAQAMLPVFCYVSFDGRCRGHTDNNSIGAAEAAPMSHSGALKGGNRRERRTRLGSQPECRSYPAALDGFGSPVPDWSPRAHRSR